MNERKTHEKYGYLEDAPTTLWDTETVINGATSVGFYIDLKKKTPSQTNMYLPGFLPEPLTFTPRSLLILGLHDHSANGHARLIIGNKHWFDCPLWLFARQASAVELFQSDAKIPCLLNFTVRLEWDTPVAAAELKLRCVLNGTMERSVS